MSSRPARTASKPSGAGAPRRRGSSGPARRPAAAPADLVIIVTGDERSPHARMYPVHAALKHADSDLWTPRRLRLP